MVDYIALGLIVLGAIIMITNFVIASKIGAILRLLRQQKDAVIFEGNAPRVSIEEPKKTAQQIKKEKLQKQIEALKIEQEKIR